MNTHNQRLIGIVITVVLLLLIPLVAMQFTREVTWTLTDFVAAGVLLSSTGLTCELVLRRVTKVRYRLVICGVILLAFALIWLELAVGIFGTPLAGS